MSGAVDAAKPYCTATTRWRHECGGPTVTLGRCPPGSSRCIYGAIRIDGNPPPAGPLDSSWAGCVAYPIVG